MRRLLAILALLAVSAPVPAFAAWEPSPPPTTAIVSGKTQPITLALNEDRGLVLTATTATGTAIDLTGSTVTLTVKKNPVDADPLISRLCTLTTPASGIATCTIAHSDTDTLPATTRTYSYDIWQTDPSGNQVRLLPASPLTLVQPLWTPDQATTGITPVPITVIGAPAVTGVEGASLTEHADGGVSWQVPNGLPSQTGKSGDYLTTDGTAASWSPLSFTAAGDVTGSLDATTVAAIQGHPVSATAPTDTQVLHYNADGGAWTPHTLTASDVGAVASVSAGTGLTATGTTNVTMSLPAVGTAGTYAICGGSITTDAEGRVTAASASSGSPVLLSPASQQTGDVNVSGTVTTGTAVNTPAMRNAGSSVAIGGNGADASTALVVSSSGSGSVSVNEGSPGAANLYIGDSSNALNIGHTDNPVSIFGRTTFKSALYLGTVQVTDANYTTNREDVISYSSLTAPRTITASSSLPGGSSSERIWIVHDESGNASALNTITWAPATGTIDGQSSEVIINKAYGAVTILGNGANFYVIGRN